MTLVLHSAGAVVGLFATISAVMTSNATYDRWFRVRNSVASSHHLTRCSWKAGQPLLPFLLVFRQEFNHSRLWRMFGAKWMKQIFCYILLLLLIFFKKSSLTLCMKRQFPNSDATIATCSFIIIKCLILFNSLHTMKGSKHYLLSLNAYNTVKVFLVQCYTFLVHVIPLYWYI